jgi:hypothetical protein
MLIDGVLLLISDVSRTSEISIQTYLRSAPPSSTEDSGMGNSDIFLGGVKFMPEFVVSSVPHDFADCNC